MSENNLIKGMIILINLDGKVAIVTGAASGIGKATAKRLAKEGAAVVVADYNAEAGEKVAEEIRAEGGKAVAQKVDVSNEVEIKAMVERAINEFGKLNILHNNAAATGNNDIDGDVVHVKTKNWDYIMAVNLRGVMLGCKYAIPEMIKAGDGSIINTSSGSALSGEYGRTAYAASKAGILALTRSVATQYGKQGIRCNAILPGLVLTPASKGAFTPEMLGLLEEGHLTPFVGEPDDIANMVTFLASDRARFITGQQIPVDGGALITSAATGILKHEIDKK
ncbi:SDR family NAD(P)-dependent oxidoreductase [Bacillus thuringiensis]|uniref:SDR family NAD(P)-dependent oxidoreductase n=1 Tax=Bacillus thuringiensis TaxID=1428 RepID=UPI0021B5C792|nr:SDR family oxidoreductase [Bacillus thuringiensis]MDH4423808.1 SDR family oxidoreductase [Bacillus cereus]